MTAILPFIVLTALLHQVESRRSISFLTLDTGIPEEGPFPEEGPCPGIFRYYYEDGQLLYGLIDIQSPNENVVQLNVELSVGNNVQGYNGDVELAVSKSKTIENILQRRMINYRVHFPRWYNIPPKVTKILVNGRLICSGPAIDLKSVRVLTTISLQHTLRINVPSSSLSGVIPEDRFDETPDFQIPASNVNPTPARDLEQVYPRNPFFSSLPPTTTTTTQRPHFHDRDFFVDNAEPPTTNAPSNRVGVNDPLCGLSISTNSLIVNGNDVEKGLYPWLVAIFTVKSLGPEFLCGGNLVSHRHVLTAGHCMKSGDSVRHVDKVFVRLGDHNIHRWTQVLGAKAVGVGRIVVHPEYRPMSADADLSVLILHEEVEFTKVIRPVCLWSEDSKLERIVGEVGSVVGWGKDESNFQVTPEPKQVRFPIVSQVDCLRSHLTFREITSERTFCAGYRNGSGPCNGDSGGGFILQRGDRWTLRGITSMSISKDRTCDFSQYFVFTDVTSFTEWIFQVMGT